MTIAVDGIVSGLETSSIIDSLVAVYSLPKEGLEDQVSEYEDKQEKISGLMSRLEDLRTSLETLNESTDFRAYTASSSDETTVMAAATGEAIEGAYSIEVDQLATSEMEVSTDSFTDYDADDTIAYGDYTITYGTNDPVTISLESDETTLQDLATAINDGVEGVTAYIINNGSDTEPYQLVLVGEDTGEDNTIDFTAGTTYGTGTVPTFTETQAAQDANFTINGISIASDSNIVSDAVPGLELTLTQETTAPVTVAVTQDTETMLANVQTFVDAYNEVQDYIDTNSVYNYDDDIRGEFVGESTVQRVASGLASAVTDIYEDVTDAYADSDYQFDALSRFGISLDSDGTMELDEDVFTDALANDFDQVEAMFTADGGFADIMLDGYTNDLGDEVPGVIDVYADTDTGTLQVRYDSLDSRIDDLEGQIEDYEARIERYEERLRSQYEAMEVTLGILEATSSYLEALFSDDDD